MRKPELRWQTRRHVAVLDPTTLGGTAHDERFVLRPIDDASAGRAPGHAWLRLTEQVVHQLAAADLELPHAVRCWLATRGSFELRLRDEAGHVLAAGPLGIEDLGDPPAPTLVTLAPSNAELVDALGAAPSSISPARADDPTGFAGRRRRIFAPSSSSRWSTSRLPRAGQGHSTCRSLRVQSSPCFTSGVCRAA